MNSKESEYGQKRQIGERSPRQWNDHDDRWRERQDYRSDLPRNGHNVYTGGIHDDMERAREKRRYSDSPQTAYTTESLSCSRNRSGPAKRCSLNDRDTAFDPMFGRLSFESRTSQEPRVSYQRQRRLTDDMEDCFEYRQREDLDWRPASKYRSSEECTYKKPREDFACRHPHEYDNDGRFPDRNKEHSPQYSSRVCNRDRNDSPVRPDYVDDWQTKTNYPVAEASGQVFERERNALSHDPDFAKGLTEHVSANKGFQLFLNVLNKGVDVNMLTKIVSHTPAASQDPLHSPNTSPTAYPDRRGSRAQEMLQNSLHWNENRDSKCEGTSRQEHHGLIGGGERHERYGQKDFARDLDLRPFSAAKADVRGGHIDATRRSTSPPAAEPMHVAPKDEQKCRQMQNLLQAIGVDLGMEELGEMSSRIQKRLYGRRESAESRDAAKDTRKETRRVFSPGSTSRSSSSGKSSFCPHTQVDASEIHQAVCPLGGNSVKNSDAGQQHREAAVSLCPPPVTTPTYTMSQPPPTPVMPPFPSAHYFPHIYSTAAPPSAVPAVAPPPALLPPPLWGPPVRPMPPFPYPPSYLPYPGVPPFPQYWPPPHPSSTFLPANGGCQVGNFDFKPLCLTQAPNTKQKPQARPRCLQTIDTDHKS